MVEHWNRRGFLRAGAAAGLLVFTAPAACSSHKPPPASTGGGGPLTITHAFGETTIPEPPKRVVSAGFTGQDDLLALGIVPVAVTNWFGDQPFGVWPWAQPKLGNAKPVVLNLDNGIQVRQIAGLKPDLIVATDAGLDQDSYQKLAAIAPTLAQSDGDAFFEPWKDQAKAIGQAVYQSGQITSLVNGVDKGFTAVADKHPQFKNKRVVLLEGKLHDDNVVATTGWRIRRWRPLMRRAFRKGRRAAAIQAICHRRFLHFHCCISACFTMRGCIGPIRHRCARRSRERGAS